MSRSPFFSVVVPAFNRATTIRRALDSVLEQSDSDFELLVVDDASTDQTSAVVAGYSDSRIELLRHPQNRGPCPARNTAIARARGRWCVMLDSDFELLPGALAALRTRAARAPDDVVNLAARCRWSDGTLSPVPVLPDAPLDYGAYLRWISGLTVSEYLNCVRRTALDVVRYPDSRAWESEFHLGLARLGRIDVAAEPLVLVHTDAPNRLTTAVGRDAVSRLIEDAADKLASFETVLREHGSALQRHAPDEHERMLLRVAQHAFLAGRRGRGARMSGELLRRRPSAVAVWALLTLGLAGPRVVGWATARRRAAAQPDPGAATRP